MQDPNDHPTWCDDHFDSTDLTPKGFHRSRPIAWGGGYVQIEEETDDGPSICVQGSTTYDEHMILSPDTARMLASALLDAADRAQGTPR